jgi:uncharacterized membrane protein affecting hemolysin expression
MMVLTVAFMFILMAVAVLISIANKDAQDRKIEALTRRLKSLETEALASGTVIYRNRG